MAEKRQYGKWTKNQLSMAITAYLNGDYGLNECARIYGVPKPTIKRHALNKNMIANGEVKAFGRSAVFPAEIEEEIEKHILKFKDMMFGLTPTDVMKLAFDIAQKNGLPHRFNRAQGLAGKKWYYAFMKRHPNLSCRQRKATSMAGVRGFDKQRVYEFFDLLEKLCDKHSLDPTRIFNADETGFAPVQERTHTIVARKGNKVGVKSNDEREVNTTMLCCVSASGQYIPPMIIFKRQRLSDELAVGAPPGSLVTMSETGYINSELFVTWLEHFISIVHPTKDRPVLLLLDGHTTHSQNLDALLLASENGVILLQLPGHTTHRLQPLDVALFSPLKTYYSQAIEKWLRSHPGQTVSLFQVCRLLGEAYGRAATVSTAINGFRSTGVWPIDRHMFRDDQFTAADILTECPSEGDNQRPGSTSSRSSPQGCSKRDVASTSTEHSPSQQMNALLDAAFRNVALQETSGVIPSGSNVEEYEAKYVPCDVILAESETSPVGLKGSDVADRSKVAIPSSTLSSPISFNYSDNAGPSKNVMPSTESHPSTVTLQYSVIGDTSVPGTITVTPVTAASTVTTETLGLDMEYESENESATDHYNESSFDHNPRRSYITPIMESVPSNELLLQQLLEEIRETNRIARDHDKHTKETDKKMLSLLEEEVTLHRQEVESQKKFFSMMEQVFVKLCQPS